MKKKKKILKKKQFGGDESSLRDLMNTFAGRSEETRASYMDKIKEMFLQRKKENLYQGYVDALNNVRQKRNQKIFGKINGLINDQTNEIHGLKITSKQYYQKLLELMRLNDQEKKQKNVLIQNLNKEKKINEGRNTKNIKEKGKASPKRKGGFIK